MAYTKYTWANGSSAVNATNMNHIEQGIYDNSLITDTVGDITTLTTNNKTNVVSAINELKNAEVYSNNEIKTNKVWINNKPIYRKVFTLTTSNDANITQNHNLTDLDEFWINYDASYIIGNSEALPPNWYYGSTTDWGRLWITSTAIRFRSPASIGSRTLYVVVEYTKTTD